jgi:glyoxylase-like metal-dependent hydrolase (beta-lactamase superfamily II)
VDDPLDVNAPLKVGQFTFKLIETPGHSPASICFYDAGHKMMFAGDHLIDGITPNPLMEMPSGPGQERPKSLVEYMASLDKVNQLDLDVVFSGHRNVITEPQRVIDTAYAHHKKRSDRVLGFLESAPMTTFQVMNKLFPDLPATEQFLGISEALGHLEWLVEAGKAAATTRDDGVVNFEAR